MVRNLMKALTGLGSRRRTRRDALLEEEHPEDVEDVFDDLPEGYRGEVRDGIPTVFAPGTYTSKSSGSGLFPRQTPQERAASGARIAAEEDRRKRNPPMRVHSFKDYYNQIDSGNKNVEFMYKTIGLTDPETGKPAKGRRYGQLYDQHFKVPR